MSKNPKTKPPRGIFERLPGSGVYWVRYADGTGRIRREKAGTLGMAKTLLHKLGLSPGVRQTVKTLLAVRWNSIVLRTGFPAGYPPAGEAEAGSAGEQPAKE